MDVKEQFCSRVVEKEIASHSKSTLRNKAARRHITTTRRLGGWTLALHEAKWGEPLRVKQEYLRKGNWCGGWETQRAQTKVVEVFEWERNCQNRRGNSQSWEDQGEGRQEKN